MYDNDDGFGRSLNGKAKAVLHINRIQELLAKSYWADKRTRETILKSIENSFCYGIYFNTVQIGFARVITDYATTYYLCDVIVDEAYRGTGLGKRLIDTIVHDEILESLFGIIATRDAHGLYAQYGFTQGGDRFMSR